MTADHDEREALRDEIARLRASEIELKARVVRAEQNLDASHALLAAAFDNLPFDFWARDQNDYCTLQNATCRANWGDLLHKRPQDSQVPLDVLETWLANNRRALAGEIVRGEYEFAKDRVRRYISNILAPIRVDGAIVGTTGVNIDVTELNRALLALRESEEKLRAAAETAGVGFWTWDSVRDEVVWDSTLSAIFGLPPGAHPPGARATSPSSTPTIARPPARRSAPGRRPVDGRTSTASCARRRGALGHGKGSPRTDGATRVVGANIDVTERKERDDQLRARPRSSRPSASSPLASRTTSTTC